MYICIYIELPNYLGRPHPEGGVGVELEGEKIKDGTQNSTDTQRMPRKCGALLTALTGNLQAAGSVTLAGQGHGGLIVVEGWILVSISCKNHGMRGVRWKFLCQ